jgi:hypothetical protein
VIRGWADVRMVLVTSPRFRKACNLRIRHKTQSKILETVSGRYVSYSHTLIWQWHRGRAQSSLLPNACRCMGGMASTFEAQVSVPSKAPMDIGAVCAKTK